MSLASGRQLAHYTILAPLGAGAMGEVYRARDSRLEREVAIKVLPEHFAEEEERLKRFEREAKALAALNHPNVAQIHGVDQVGDYVQPFPGPGPREPISTGGGESPLWSRDGSELFYATPDRLLAVDVTTTPVFSASAPRVVFEGRYRDTVNGNTPFSVSADGQRFLRVQQVQPELAVTHIELVPSWFAELEQAAAPRARPDEP